MPQFQLRIRADREEAERIAHLLESALEDESISVSWFETPTEGWAVDAWLGAETAAEMEARVREVLGSDCFGAPMSVTPVDPAMDWVSLSLQGLKPVIGGRFVVFGRHDRDQIPAGLIKLQIEANQAFGTGHHPTTWGCLTALSRLTRTARFQNVFDLGTGSGVLAIAAAKETRRSVLASDIDALSVEIAAENARLNGVGRRVRTITAAGFDHRLLRGRVFDLILANILAGPLKRLAPAFRAHSRPGGHAVLSGILTHQAPSVLASFRAQGFVRAGILEKEEWSTLVLRRITA